MYPSPFSILKKLLINSLTLCILRSISGQPFKTFCSSSARCLFIQKNSTASNLFWITLTSVDGAHRREWSSLCPDAVDMLFMTPKSVAFLSVPINGFVSSRALLVLESIAIWVWCENFEGWLKRGATSLCVYDTNLRRAAPATISKEENCDDTWRYFKISETVLCSHDGSILNQSEGTRVRW